ncbi:hypothetical protein [Salmonella enterica]|uniref:hypothetical protein n=1 Tax=Salmonella enterica TaxID=28901 RepID=UPI00398C3904
MAVAPVLHTTRDVGKVVLARLIGVPADVAVDSGALLERRVAQNPVSGNCNGRVAEGGGLMGAGPEVLMRKEGERFSSLA